MALEPHPETPMARPERRRALVVESDTGSSTTVCHGLSELGFDVTSVACGVDAVIAARRSAPVLIFLATQLRDVTGMELASWLRSNPTLAAVPIVAMLSSGESAHNLLTGGFTALLKKPISAAKVAQAVKDVSLGAI